jgi:hypothetical protein
MSERKLRRQRVIFYISRALENVPKAFQSAAARRDYYSRCSISSRPSSSTFTGCCWKSSVRAARVLPMSDLDHFRHYKRFLNPSLNDRFDLIRQTAFARTLHSGELLAQRGQRAE